MYVSFMDPENAYNRVNREAMWQVLYHVPLALHHVYGCNDETGKSLWMGRREESEWDDGAFC